VLTKNTLRGQSFWLDMSSLGITAIALAVSIWVIFNHLQNRFIDISKADASKVNVFIDAELAKAKNSLTLFANLSVSDRSRLARHQFDDFSDIYALNALGDIVKTYKSVPSSRVFQGFTFNAGSALTQMMANDQPLAISPLMRGYEDELPSVYILWRAGSETILGRLNLEYVEQFIDQYSQLTGNLLLLTTNRGVVMVSPRPDVTLPSIDIGYWSEPGATSSRLKVAGESWIPLVVNSDALDAKLVVLVSTALVDGLRNTLLATLAILLLGLLVLVGLKNRGLRQYVLAPIDSLLGRMQAMESGVSSFAPEPGVMYLEEFEQLDRHFQSMAQAIEQREKALESVNQDIRDRESKLQLILQRLPIPLIVFRKDQPCKIDFINASFEQVFGYRGDQTPNLAELLQALCQNNQTAVRVAQELHELIEVESLSDPDQSTREVTIVCRGGQQHDVIVSAISLGETAIATFVDVTALRESERELRRAKLFAEEQERQKADFLAVMSHELRTPLTSIIGMTQLLAREPLGTRQAELVHRLIEADQSLLHIINDILDHSKIEAGELRLTAHPFSLRGLLHKIVNLFEWMATNKSIDLLLEIDSDCPALLIGDAFRLEQVLSNLVGNAIKFTQVGAVTVRVGLQQQVGQVARLRFEVRDTGSGISELHQETIFLPFKQADIAVASRVGGTGLGLSITKRLVQLMQGQIGLSSQPGQGSTFWFELSLELSAPGSITSVGAIGSTSTDIGCLHGTRVLVADDSESIQFLVNEVLSVAGARVTCVGNGQLALASLKDRSLRYDAVLMDIQMPVMDGIACARAIRADQALVDVPIIAMTAGSLEALSAEILGAGANIVIAKPIKIDKLAQIVGEQLVRS